MNENLFKTKVLEYAKPIMSVLTWLAPIACAIYCLVEGVKWFGMDENERAQKSYWKTVKNGVIVCVIVVAITTILQIFGLTVPE